MNAKRDLANYMALMASISSHLRAAREAATAIYSTNPCTHRLNAFDALSGQLEGIERDVQRAQSVADAKLNN